jgi:hypothetical protein
MPKRWCVVIYHPQNVVVVVVVKKKNNRRKYVRGPSEQGRQSADESQTPSEDEKAIGPIARHFAGVLHRPNDGEISTNNTIKKQNILE